MVSSLVSDLLHQNALGTIVAILSKDKAVFHGKAEVVLPEKTKSLFHEPLRHV